MKHVDLPERPYALRSPRFDAIRFRFLLFLKSMANCSLF
jgi:hypothetical protein